eukprot:TRINITY_DN124187_c0_g1_i1.p1 TRINITY_DN124187_c0_g1~~TRINITY_DN124187_c0_g1_i1.p1  ORF type:complete len:148 (+),score=1.31 TRINITY_DN124187_c0_g1_i1:82-525(+)
MALKITSLVLPALVAFANAVRLADERSHDVKQQEWLQSCSCYNVTTPEEGGEDCPQLYEFVGSIGVGKSHARVRHDSRSHYPTPDSCELSCNSKYMAQACKVTTSGSLDPLNVGAVFGALTRCWEWWSTVRILRVQVEVNCKCMRGR